MGKIVMQRTFYHFFFCTIIEYTSHEVRMIYLKSCQWYNIKVNTRLAKAPKLFSNIIGEIDHDNLSVNLEELDAEQPNNPTIINSLNDNTCTNYQLVLLLAALNFIMS